MSTLTTIDSWIEKFKTVASKYDLYVIYENENFREKDSANGPFARFRVFDSESQTGSVSGTGTLDDVEIGNVIVQFYDDVDNGKELHKIVSTARADLIPQFDQIKVKISRVETLGAIERPYGNGRKWWYRIDLRMTFEKYEC
jgi:hypothetical protein